MAKKITILGAGESGVGAAILAIATGYEVFVSDSGSIKEEFKKELELRNIIYEEGLHSDIIFDSAEVIKSPGIPDDAEIITKIRSKNIPVISELEFASRFTSAKIILITGTNGKTTTTLLTHHLLKSAGIDAGLAGNVGFSLARMIADDPKEVYVVEVSSFQLDQSYKLKADIAVLLNITPDHLDRYGNDLTNYINSKFRVIQNMKAGDHFICNYDDDIIKTRIESRNILPEVIKVSLRNEVETGGYLKGDIITTRLKEKEYRFNTIELPLKGNHNAVNMMASILCAMNLGIGHQSILEGIKSFKNAPHRMEHVTAIKGIDFVNDSKATNVDSAYYALGSYPAIVWIAGGKDKGNNYDQLREFAREKVKALVCLGKDNSKLLNYFRGVVPSISDTHTIKDAVRKAFSHAQKGDTVLLSPACASFDLFKNYEDRGDQFRNEVLELKKELEKENNRVL